MDPLGEQEWPLQQAAARHVAVRLSWLSALIPAVAGCAYFTVPSVAQACDYGPPAAWEHVETCDIEPASELCDDSEAPSAIGGADVEVSRGRPRGNGASCEDLGNFHLSIDPGTDNLTPSEALGYQVRYLGGELPGGLDEHLLEGIWTDDAYVIWSETERDPFDFEIGVRPIDLAGNLGPETEVAISSNGCECSSSGGSSPAWMLPLVALLGVVRVGSERRRRKGLRPR
jgi:MYXO-CTERM domain-containing protein